MINPSEWKQRELKPMFSCADTGSDVVLHVYDVSDTNVVSAANEVFQAIGTGLFHVGVEVYGWEWSYGFAAAGTGVFASLPRACKARRYRQPIPLGRTKLSLTEVQDLLRELQQEWLGGHYNLVRHNCIHFSEALCQRLSVTRPLPKWIRRFVSVGAAVQDFVDAMGKAGNLVEAAVEVAATSSGVRSHIHL
eukprot:CAMPEP_0171108558 /NCGR_PEP_ID=MMETSP0766_2-20121228/69169_1 /TAXON_ID=439317 /ORGANISM="Gambierdiscus australes, Strain CAWD 149" /LENGTH=191 /DNA_ID=CAMNT_0011570117 /DNA_START=63 /DNA_END=638 /DNA_ORIENTATION=+